MTPSEILSHVRKLIEEHAKGDPDRWWYANRFVFARLMLDERKTKTAIKQRLFEQSKPCHFCGKPFTDQKDVPLHRLDEEKGYSDANCVLAHKECHQAHHRKSTRKAIAAPGRPVAQANAQAVVAKCSKRYEGGFFYWWDISPALAGALDGYEAVEFVCEDTKASCLVPVSVLKPLLTPERQTSRGAGNWGVKVLRNHEDELSFEPGKGNGEWAYLPVVWMAQEAED